LSRANARVEGVSASIRSEDQIIQKQIKSYIEGFVEGLRVERLKGWFLFNSRTSGAQQLLCSGSTFQLFTKIVL